MLKEFLSCIDFPHYDNIFNLSFEKISYVDYLEIDVYETHSFFGDNNKSNYNYRKRNSLKESWICLDLNFHKDDSLVAFDSINNFFTYNNELPISIDSFSNSKDGARFFKIDRKKYRIDFLKIDSALSIQITKF